MKDKEKVRSEFLEWCNYMDEMCPVVCLDVLKLLNEQEPVEVKISNKYWAVCEGCMEHFRIFMMPATRAKYCPNCGRRVKWE